MRWGERASMMPMRDFAFARWLVAVAAVCFCAAAFAAPPPAHRPAPAAAQKKDAPKKERRANDRPPPRISKRCGDRRLSVQTRRRWDFLPRQSRQADDCRIHIQ